MIKLDIGCGDNPRPGFIGIDRKTGEEAYPLKYEDGSIDEIVASHVLEHFGNADAVKALADWVRVLKPGGTIRIAVPNFDKIIDIINAGNPQGLPIQGYVYGGQTDANDFHRSGYNEEWLTHLLTTCGLVDIKSWESEIDDCARLPVSLNLQGTKPTEMPPVAKPFPKHRKITAVMSMPRLAFSGNMFSALQAFVPLGISFEKVEGAWWDQCLERVMLPHLSDGTDYIITLDYDSVFRWQHVHQLAVLMEENPQADAICPVQFKRAEDVRLFKPIDEQGRYIEGPFALDNDLQLLPIGWGHFGLTIFRVSSLKKMSHPWFLGKPAPDGTWGEGRVDPDIAFWDKFRSVENNLFLATHVGIGHLELMASLPDQNLKRFHVHAEDLQKSWPDNARK